MNETKRLEGRVAIVTGGGGSMGGAQSRLFAEHGASVCVADFNLESAESVSADINADGGSTFPFELDVRSEDAWTDAVKSTESRFGPVSILSNIAGANFRVSFDDQTLDMWNTIMDTGLTGAFLGIKAVIPSMRRAGGGAILNIGSLASIRPGGGSPAYAAQKMGMIGLTRAAAASYATDNIRCVLISPGHVDTPFIRGNNPYSPNDWNTSIDNPDNLMSRVGNTPLGRMCSADDLAKAFLFAASEDASMITGSMITVDGGAAL